jgi:hypothetical protein
MISELYSYQHRINLAAETDDIKYEGIYVLTSLLTIRFVFISYKVGTVNRPLYSGSTEK